MTLERKYLPGATAHAHTEADITGLAADLAGKASLASARMRGLAVGKYYSAGSVGAATGTLTQSRLRVAAYYFDEPFTFDRIGTDVTTSAASSTLRWVVYADSSGYPGALILDTGAGGDSTATGFKEATVSQALSTGRCWIGAVPQGGNPTVRIVSAAVGVPGVGLTSAEIVSLAGIGVGYFTDSVTGAAPSTFPAGAAASSSAAAVWLRKA